MCARLLPRKKLSLQYIAVQLIVAVTAIAAIGLVPARAADLFQLDRFLSELLYVDLSYTAKHIQFINGTPQITSTIAYSSGKERVEIFQEELDMTIVGITRADKAMIYAKTTSVEMTTFNTETHTPFADLPAATDIEKNNPVIESVSGVEATRYEVTATLDNGAIVTGDL